MTVKEMPNAELDVLRFQIGEMEFRYEVWPVYGAGDVSLGYRTTQHKTAFFHLYGYGSTMELAEARVREKFPNYGLTVAMPPVAEPVAPSHPPELQPRVDTTVIPLPVDRINITPPGMGDEAN